MVGETVIAQTGVIGRFAARVCNLYPDGGAVDEAKAESVIDRLGDLGVISWYTAAEADQAAVLSAVKERLPAVLLDLEQMLESGSKEWLIGSKLSFADLAVYAALHEIISIGCEPAHLFSNVNVPLTWNLFERVGKIPAVSKFVDGTWPQRTLFFEPHPKAGPRVQLNS